MAAFAKERWIATQTGWRLPPTQAPARVGAFDVGGAALDYWRAGGGGDAVVLLHPFTGSAESWLYQQPALAGAGFDVVGYSRRGALSGPPVPGAAVLDLHRLMAGLGIARFHLVGCAAGGIVALEYALSYPEQVGSLTVACSLMGIADASHLATTAALLPKGIDALPRAFRELGPSYRAGFPEGVALWERIEARARERHSPSLPPPAVAIDRAAIAGLECPLLLATGEADLYMPPSRLRDIASDIPRAEVAIFAEAGHGVHWEQPDAFNVMLLDFLSRHPL